MSTTPNDAARPVVEVIDADWGTAFNLLGRLPAVGTKLYTATDYDKLREEVERLQMLCYEISRDCNACANERNEQRARAEAAEARATTAMNLTDQWRRRAHELRYNPAAMPFAAECIEECAKQLDAAINAQGENK